MHTSMWPTYDLLAMERVARKIAWETDPVDISL